MHIVLRHSLRNPPCNGGLTKYHSWENCLSEIVDKTGVTYCIIGTSKLKNAFF